ncbi:MAG: ATP synthase F1 subunit delta [Oscillospiraceae bacterium]|nr:ATP synthase F1 subunit delta [Oscillospiraceae bacterium]
MERLSVLYASALFDLAKGHNKLDEFFEQAVYLRNALQDEQCQRILVHPHITAAQKHELFKKAFSGHVHEDLLGLMFLTADKNREAFLLPALDCLIELIRRHKGIITAEVSSAVAFDEQQAETLKRVLSEQLHKSVELELKVDSSLIGGPYIFVDGYYIDWTIKKKLRDLTVYMKEGCSA